MIKEFRLERALSTEGWMTPTELRFLAERASEAKVIFEIGCYKGRSTRAMADNTCGKIYAIDPWTVLNIDQIHSMNMDTTQVFNQFCCNMMKHIDSGKVIVCPFPWEIYQPEEKADFIFIDGDHRYDHIVHDIHKALKWITPGGVISGHDYRDDFPDVQRAVKEIFGPINSVDAIWWKHV